MDLNPKDPIFTTQQTDSSFILTSHIKEYGRRNINIEINEDGSIITISGELADDHKMKGFRKTFKIPEGVVLDKVKARFDQDESRLTIKMPKSVKGLTGIQGLEDTTVKEENHQEITQEEDVMSNGGTKLDLHQQHKKQQIIQYQDHQEVSVYDKEKQEENEAIKPSQKSSSPNNIPILAAGSVLFVSLLVIAFNLFRSRHESNQKRH